MDLLVLGNLICSYKWFKDILYALKFECDIVHFDHVNASCWLN